MKKNALFPYAIIAVLGVVMVIVMATAGNNQRNTMNSEGEEEVVKAPEEIYANSCASCHANDLSGDFGPALTNIGSELSAEEIIDIIENGKGNMPAGTAGPEDAKIVSEWLAEEHK